MNLLENLLANLTRKLGFPSKFSSKSRRKGETAVAVAGTLAFAGETL